MRACVRACVHVCVCVCVQARYAQRKDKALATIVLAVDTSLLYLLGADPKDPKVVW